MDTMFTAQAHNKPGQKAAFVKYDTDGDTPLAIYLGKKQSNEDTYAKIQRLEKWNVPFPLPL